MMATTFKITGVSPFYRSCREGAPPTWMEDLMTGDDCPPFLAKHTGIVAENGKPIVELPSGRRMNLNYFEYERISKDFKMH